LREPPTLNVGFGTRNSSAKDCRAELRDSKQVKGVIIWVSDGVS
jgi:hypothetical protein